MKFVTPYSDEHYAQKGKHATVNDEPSLAQAQFAQDCDINVLAERFGLTGQTLPPAVVGDVLSVPIPATLELRDVLEVGRQASEAFQGLDAKLRARFDNDPVKLARFLADPENQPEAARLGFIVPDPSYVPGTPPNALQTGGEA